MKQPLVFDTDRADNSVQDAIQYWVYLQLPDGRMAPVEKSGMVEFALFELGAQLVDYSPAPEASSLLTPN